MRSWLALALAISTAGCTFSDGEPFGSVSVTLDARYEERADRDAGDGWQKLTSELEVKLSEIALEVTAVELVDLGGEEALSFDPANPPPGYSLCHNGHCHSDEGALVDYEDIEAELGGDEVTRRTALQLEGAEVDLMTDEPVALACVGDCSLGMGHIARIRIGVHELHVAGQVRDGLAEPRFEGELDIGADIDLTGGDAGVLEVTVDLPIDDEHEPRIRIALSLAANAGLFDDAIEDGGTLDVAAVRSALGEQTIETNIERTEPE